MKMPKILKNRKAMIGVEAAIILIAFVIVAAAFSFMVVNMGLFATQRGRDTIQQGIAEASTPLMLDGSLLIKGVNTTHINATVIPLKTLGVKYVPLANETTVVTLRIGNHTAYANIYNGIDTTDPTGQNYSYLASLVADSKSTAMLFVENSNGDDSLNSQEKGYLVIVLSDSDIAKKRDPVFIELRPEKGAPLSIEFVVPSELQQGWLTLG